MIEHRSPQSGIACHPSGLIATAGYDNKVILWDPARNTAVSWGSHDHLVNHCAFSPDGSRLVTASSDYSARVWQVPKLRLQSVLLGHGDDVEMAVFSPDGGRIATACRDHRIRIFDVSGSLLTSGHGHESDVLSIAWSVDGATAISAGDDGTVRRWCALTGRQLELVTSEGVETDTVVVCGDGAVLSGNDNGGILYLRNGVSRLTPAHNAGIKRLAIDSDGKLLVSTSYDLNMKIWRVGNAGELNLLQSTEMPAVVWARSVAITPKGTIVMGTFGSRYASYDPRTRQWDLDRVRPIGGLNAVTLAHGGTYAVGDSGIVYCDGVEKTDIGSLCNFLLPWQGGLLTGGHMGVLFDALKGRPVHRHRSPLNCGIALSEDRVLIGSYTGEAILLQANAGGELRHLRDIQMHGQAIKGMALGVDTIFTVSAAGDAAIWRRHDLTLIAALPGAHDKIANGVAALPDGRFVSVSRDLKLRLWSGRQVTVVPSPHDHSIKCVSVSRNGRWIATGSYSGEVRLYDLEGRVWTHAMRPTTSGISCLAQSCAADGFVASSYDGQLYSVVP